MHSSLRDEVMPIRGAIWLRVLIDQIEREAQYWPMGQRVVPVKRDWSPPPDECLAVHEVEELDELHVVHPAAMFGEQGCCCLGSPVLAVGYRHGPQSWGDRWRGQHVTLSHPIRHL